MKDESHSEYFPSLTGIRAIAAYMVFLHHFNPFDSQAQPLLYNFVGEFHIGVTLFFVLSGFLITYRYYEKPVPFKTYLKNRIARIYPMFFILTTLTFLSPWIIEGLVEKQSLSIYLSNITFAKGFFDDLKFTGISQSWSLTVEEVFYFTAPVLFVLIFRKYFMLFVLPVLLISIGCFLVYLFKDMNISGFYKSFDFMFNYTFTGRCIEFFTGIVLALFIKNEYKNKFGYYTYIGFIVVFLCAFLISCFKGNYDFGIRHPIGIFINTFILPVAGISILFFGLLTEETYLKRILSSKPFIKAGKSSYVFYLIHVGVFQILISKYFTNNYLVIFILLLFLSYLFYYFIEEPMNKFIRKLRF